MVEHYYDVFERSESAFELVSDEEMQSTHHPRDEYAGGTEVEIAHAVSAATAAELVGLNCVPEGIPGFTDPVAWLESHVAEFGSLAVGTLTENWEVRRSCDD